MKSRPQINEVRQVAEEIRARLDRDGRDPGLERLSEQQRVTLGFFAGALEWAAKNDTTYLDFVRGLLSSE